LQQGQFRTGGTLGPRLATPHLVRLLGEWRGGGTAYVELAAALRGLAVEGRLPPHTRLPSERTIASALGVSRNTATAALDLLRQEGYLASRRGAGSWVTLRRAPEGRPDERLPAQPDVIDLTLANLPGPADLGTLARAAAAAVAGELGGPGYEPFGLAATREAVADHLSARGLRTAPDQVLITQGALHAWDLALRTLARPGDPVLVENPTYPGALDAIRAHGCRPIGVPIGPDGWDLALMRTLLRDARPRLGYLIPDFHNPTGVRIGADQRAIVARLARAAGVVVISDESLADLWLDEAEVVPSLAAGDDGGGVLAVGSLSKTVWGGLRTGWMRADPDLARRLALARASQDVGSPVLDQLLAVQALRRLDELLPARRAMLGERRDALLAALAASRPAWRVDRPAGGMCLWAQLPAGIAASALAVRAGDHAVRVAPGPRFGVEGGFEQRLRLPFTQPPLRLAEAVRRLAVAEDGLGRRPVAGEAADRWVA
jgi:DNA-binding transcriptional MocR family regulator